MPRQICEGCDYKSMPARQHFCISDAHWKVETEWLTIFLCTTCHAIAELTFAEKAIPRKTEYAEPGYPAQAGHGAANERHSAAVARKNGKPKIPKAQLELFP